MLKRFRLTRALVLYLSIFLCSSLSKIFVHSLNVSNTRNLAASRQLLREEQIGLPILFNHTLDYIIPRRRLLDHTTADTNNSSDIGNSTILDVSIDSNSLIYFGKDNDTFIIETTLTVDPFPTLPSISINIESFSSTLEPEEAATHVRRKRDALVDQNQNRLKRKEEMEENEKIDRKRSSAAEKNEKISSTDEREEATNVRNSNDDDLDDYNAVDEKSSVDAEESNENEENLEEEASQEEPASRSKDSKMKRESNDYEYLEDQENALDDTNDKKIASDVRVKRDEAESAKRTNENIKLEDNSANEAKMSEVGNVEASSKEEETSANIIDNENQDSKVAITANKDSKVAVAENKDSKELDSKRDAFKNKVDSVKSSKESVLSMNNGKDDTVVDTKSKEEERGTRTAAESNDNYEKRVEEQIKRKIDSIKEEIKREIERKRRDREIERNNAKFDDLQGRDSDQEEEEESLESGQNSDEGPQSKRSAENTKESTMKKRKRRSNENELTRQQLEEIEGVENLKDEDYRLADLTHESIQKRFAPVYEEPSNEEEESNKIVLNKAPVKKREKVRQMFIVKNEDKQRRKKRAEAKESRKVRAASEVRHAKKDKIQGRKRKRRIASGRQVLIPEQARVKIVDELPRDLTLDPRLRRSLPINNGKQVRIKRENERLEGRMVALEYRPQSIEDEENDEGNEFGDDGFEDRTSNLRDRRINSLTDRRLYEEREGEENDEPLNFLFSGIHDERERIL